MLKNMCCETKKQQFCLFFDGPFVDLGLDHSFDIKFFWGIPPVLEPTNIKTNMLSASKGTVREHGTDSTKGGHPSPRGPGACVILPCKFDAMTPVNNFGNSVLKPVLNLYITRNLLDLLVISGHPIYQSLIC